MTSRGDFPFFQQRGTFGCGLASLKMIMDYYGKKNNLYEIKTACGISGRGAFLSELITGAELLGFYTLVIRCDIKDLSSKIPLPAIILWENKHYNVVYDVDSEWVYVADPAKGLTQYSHDEFRRGWYQKGERTGVLIAMKPTSEFTLKKGATLTIDMRG